jgi:hypothetical protein
VKTVARSPAGQISFSCVYDCFINIDEGFTLEPNDMEKLTPREEVFLPDVRYRNSVNLDLSSGVVSEITIDTIYDELEQIQLNASVPESVRSHFEIAREIWRSTAGSFTHLMCCGNASVRIS